MFNNVSEFANQVDFAMAFIIGISIVMLIGVTAVMLYFIFRYSHKRNPNPIQTHGSMALETVWIVVPTIIVIGMFYVGYADFSENRGLLDNPDNVVKVTGQQFDWRFTYENEVTLDTLFVPVNKITRFDITSVDVIHSFYIPALRIKEDAVPGRTNSYGINPLQMGSYDIACAEYCGVNHWNMYTTINVVSQEEYDKWYASIAPKEEVATDTDNTKDEENTVENATTEESTENVATEEKEEIKN